MKFAPHRPHTPWQVLATRDVYSAPPWLTVSLQEVCLPDGRVVNDYHRVQMPDYTVVFAETEDGRVLAERQYKHGIGRVTLTLPAGLVDAGEDALRAAQRELLEETGYTASDWKHLGSFVPNSNYGCGKAHLYSARRARRVADPNAGDLEEIEIILLTRDALLKALGAGQIHSLGIAMTIALATNPHLSDQPPP
jgi:ADP-ribose pyrophosphatase